MSELYVDKHLKSAVTEGFKTIRTNLRFSSASEKFKTIVITSSGAGEGKSFVCANLAATFAIAKEKVLIIDCDLRKGRQQAIFEKNNNQNLGMSNLLIEDDWKTLLKEYIMKTDIENLDLLVAGTVPPNPTVLLESPKMLNIIQELKKKYDVIIFDTPPVNGLNDTLVLARYADAVLIVASAKKTNMDLLENTKRLLGTVKANIVGVILNKVEKNDSKYYHSYYTDK